MSGGGGAPWWNPQTRSWDTGPRDEPADPVEPAADPVTPLPDGPGDTVLSPQAPYDPPPYDLPQAAAPGEGHGEGAGDGHALAKGREAAQDGAHAGVDKGVEEDAAGPGDADGPSGPGAASGPPPLPPRPPGFEPAVPVTGAAWPPADPRGPAGESGAAPVLPYGPPPGFEPVEPAGADAADAAGSGAYGPPEAYPPYGPPPYGPSLGGAAGGPVVGGSPEVPYGPPPGYRDPGHDAPGRPSGGGRSPGGAVRRWVTPLTAAVAVAALAAGGGVVWFLQRDDDRPTRLEAPVDPSRSGDDTGAPAPPAPTGDPSAPPSEEGSPSPSGRAELPTGFRTVRDEEGFDLAVPEGWARTKEPQGVFFRSADGESLLQVFRVDEADMSPLEAVRGASTGLAAQPAYREVSVTELPAEPGDSGAPAAELVYEYDSKDTGTRRRGVERVFLAPSGRKYAVLVRAPAEEWPRQHETLKTAVAHFWETTG
ncbi:hypothetical protein [Streptomyces sp. NPDC097619]|uniref:hypothetical protein n=1 Tax=Streptomyces sp. NPDC097619 TaxID=3157228 RepID=UPI00331CE137